MARDLGYHLHVIEKEKDHRRDISSTYIREELEKGNVEKANQLLGQPYAIHGGSSARQPHRRQPVGLPHSQYPSASHQAPAQIRRLRITGAGGRRLL